MTFDTVGIETPATRATSPIVTRPAPGRAPSAESMCSPYR